MAELIHLVYASAAAQDLQEKDIRDILKISVTNNYASDITGMLLFAEGSFLQVLEGEKNAVQGLFEQIKKDSRHWDVIKIFEERIDSRFFGDWSMGMASLEYSDLAQVPGCKDFFESGEKLSFLKESVAKKLLQAFKEGELRQHLK